MLKALGYDKSSEITELTQTFEACHYQLLNGDEITGKHHVVSTSEGSHLHLMVGHSVSVETDG